MYKIKVNIAQAGEWDCWQQGMRWFMTHPIGLSAIMDFKNEILSIKRDADGKMLINEHTDDMYLSDIPVMLNNVARDEKTLLGRK